MKKEMKNEMRTTERLSRKSSQWIGGKSTDKAANKAANKATDKATDRDVMLSCVIAPEKRYSNLLISGELYQKARGRLNELQIICAKREAAIQKAPEGKLRMIHCNDYPQYYVRMNPSDTCGEYLSKSDFSRIKLLLQKKYDEKIVKLMHKEIASLEELLRNAAEIPQQIKQVYASLPNEAQSMICPIDCTNEQYADYWEHIPYVGKEIQNQTTIQKTDRGEYVRSKSELNIANALFKKGIPYKYECPLTLRGGLVIYPDFTILHPKTRKIFYWEHRGMMDDREYVKHSVVRVKDYQREGIVVGVNLIISEESSNSPLGTNEIQALIKAFFGV